VIDLRQPIRRGADVEVQHQPVRTALGILRGASGIQWSNRDLQAAGADGILLGTRFLATVESPAIHTVGIWAIAGTRDRAKTNSTELIFMQLYSTSGALL
jgi:hypothetical protein